MDWKFKFPNRWAFTELRDHEGGMGDDPHIEVKPVVYDGMDCFSMTMTGNGKTVGPVTAGPGWYENKPLAEYSGPLSEFPY